MIEGCKCYMCEAEKEANEAFEKHKRLYKMNVEDYHKGFLDGISCNQKYPQTFTFMGRTIDELIKIIKDDEYNKNKNREAFRKALGDAGFAGFTLFSSPILEAYDKVHCPVLRK